MSLDKTLRILICFRMPEASEYVITVASNSWTSFKIHGMIVDFISVMCILTISLTTCLLICTSNGHIIPPTLRLLFLEWYTSYCLTWMNEEALGRVLTAWTRSDVVIQNDKFRCRLRLRCRILYSGHLSLRHLR